MKKLIGIIILGVFYTTSASATECSIQFGGGGKNSAVYSLKNGKATKSSNLGSPWSFIRSAKGPCRFTLYNKSNYKGRKVQYGEIRGRQRVGAKDGHDKGGWKVRSMTIEPLSTRCGIELSGFAGLSDLAGRLLGGHIYSGPSSFSHISALSGIYKTSGDSSCRYTLYNENNFGGRQITVGKVNKDFRNNWRIRSLKITNKVSNSTKLVPSKTKRTTTPRKLAKPMVRKVIK